MANPNVAIVGPSEYVREGAWATEDMKRGLAREGLNPVVIERPSNAHEMIAIEDQFIEGKIAALVLANYEADSGERFPFDDHMSSVTDLAFEAKVPIFTMQPIDTEPFKRHGPNEVIFCKPTKLIRLVKNRLGERI